MKNLDGRLSKLETRFGIARNGPTIQLILNDRELVPIKDVYVQILEDGGFPPPGGHIIDFTVIPRGLSAEETERFVRENGAKICGSRFPQIPPRAGSA